ncbi:MAG: serine/threonine protein kinase [Williamsia sp.]|nr:serine/threonine protein kinase [Williamsia sp.]
MPSYKLSHHICILPLDEGHYTQTPLQYRKDHFILHDKRSNSDFLINSTIKYFLDKFLPAKTPEEVVREIAGDIQAGADQIKKTCRRFFRFLHKRKILIPADQVEMEETGDRKDTLYKENDRVDGLLITKTMAASGCIDIYLALDETDRQLYVIKLLNPKNLSNPAQYNEELADLEREYSTLQHINHLPVISHAYGFYRNSDQHAYIKLAYIDGRSLSRYIKEKPTLCWTDCVELISNTCQAFAQLHAHNIVHGDIHPSNVLASEGNKIKIIDLGLALNRNIEKNELQSFGGANFYMPPERINLSSFNKFSRMPGFQSDVYQIGLLIYLVCYGQEPFTGFVWEELAKNIKEGRPAYPAQSFQGQPIPASLVKIMKKALHKNHRHRYKDANELYQHISRLN